MDKLSVLQLIDFDETGSGVVDLAKFKQYARQQGNVQKLVLGISKLQVIEDQFVFVDPAYTPLNKPITSEFLRPPSFPTQMFIQLEGNLNSSHGGVVLDSSGGLMNTIFQTGEREVYSATPNNAPIIIQPDTGIQTMHHDKANYVFATHKSFCNYEVTPFQHKHAADQSDDELEECEIIIDIKTLEQLHISILLADASNSTVYDPSAPTQPVSVYPITSRMLNADDDQPQPDAVIEYLNGMYRATLEQDAYYPFLELSEQRIQHYDPYPCMVRRAIAIDAYIRNI